MFLRPALLSLLMVIFVAPVTLKALELDIPSLFEEEASRLKELKTFCDIANQKFVLINKTAEQSSTESYQKELLQFLETAPDPALTLKLMDVYLHVLDSKAIEQSDFDLGFVFESAHCANRSKYRAFENILKLYANGSLQKSLEPKFKKMLQNYLSLESFSVFDPIDTAIRSKLAIEASALNLIKANPQLLLLWNRMQSTAQSLGREMIATIQSLEDLKKWSDYTSEEKDKIRNYVFKITSTGRPLLDEWGDLINTANRTPFKSKTKS